MPLPPFRASHLLSEWIGCTLEIRCACGRSSHPSVLLLLDQWADRPFADLIPRLRCQACDARPANVWLVAGLHRQCVGGPPPDWAVEMVGR